jgi:diguanylate cyclase (GGDEF)-like protein
MSSFASSPPPDSASMPRLSCEEDPFDADEPPTRPGETPNPAARPRLPPRVHAILTMMAGINAGQVFTVDRDASSVGRSKEADMCIDGVGVSRKHARILRANGGYVIENVGASQGVFVNGERVDKAALESGDRIQLGPAVVLRFALVPADERALAIQLHEGSTRDALTRTFNRRYFDQRLAEEVAYAKRHTTHLGIILFDLDHFKRINDMHGHIAGDAVLRIVATQLQRIIRREDVLARYGGEEFVVLLRGIEHKNVGILAERLRRAVEALRIPMASDSLQATVSMGAASLSECATDPSPEALVQLADERLYDAKEKGRNRVCL